MDERNRKFSMTSLMRLLLLFTLLRTVVGKTGIRQCNRYEASFSGLKALPHELKDLTVWANKNGRRNAKRSDAPLKVKVHQRLIIKVIIFTWTYCFPVFIC